MKKVLLALVVIGFIFIGCNEDNSSNDPYDPGAGFGPGQNNYDSSLNIKNETSYTLSEVKWNGNFFTLSSDDMYGQGFNGGWELSPGNSSKVDTKSGSGYVYFNTEGVQNNKYYEKKFRTSTLVTVSKGENADFIILSSTVVVDLSNEESGTLSSFFNK